MRVGLTIDSGGKMWPSLPAVVALAALALAGCTYPRPIEPPPGPSAATHFNQGVAAFAAGHFGLAVKAFNAAIDEAPGSVAALNGLAAAYDHLGRYDLAARTYGRALAVDPNSPQTLNNIGYSYMLQGKFDLAAVFLRDAQRNDPDDPAIAANRAIAEGALHAGQPRPDVQWRPNTKNIDPPRVRIERSTPIVQRLVGRPVSPSGKDTLPGMLTAPIGDTHMAAEYDRLPGPIAASMADVRLVAPPALTSGGTDNDVPG